MPLDTVKEAKGFFSKDKYMPIIQAIINIILSIFLAIKIGLNGVIIATTISYITTVCWNKPFVIYKYLFNDTYLKYFIEQFKYIVIIIFDCLITIYLFNYINLPINFINIIFIGIVCTIIYLITTGLIFYKKKEFIFIKNFIFDNFNNLFKNKKCQ